MIKISIEKLIKSNPEKVFSIFTDFENYSKLLPQYFPSVRTRSSRNNVSVVEQHIVIGNKELVMMVKHIIDFPKKHEISIIGGDCKGSQIIEEFESVGDNTKLYMEAKFMTKTFFGLKNIISKNELEQGLLSIVDEFLKLCKEIK